MNRKIKTTIKQWCIDNNRQDILERWDYKLNDVSPDNVAAYSKTKRYLKCPKGIHVSELYDMDYLCRHPEYKAGCRSCNSFAQYIIDQHGEEYLNKIWSEKNEKSPWDYTHASQQKVWFNCLDNPEHIYKQIISNRTKDCMCPLCNNKNTYTKIDYNHSLGVVCPKSINVWSEKNEKTVYDYAPHSGKYAWWKCENGIHDDFSRKICNSYIRGFKCPYCAQENKYRPSGPDHPNWKGTTPEAVSARMNMDYKNWRKSVYERDGYVCQICLDKTHDRLQAHHIFSFARYPKIRYELKNAISLCEQCHDNHFKGSFHQTYGTIDNTPEQLQEYANKRRQELGITEPFDINKYTNGLDPTTLPYPEELPPDLDPVIVA